MSIWKPSGSTMGISKHSDGSMGISNTLSPVYLTCNMQPGPSRPVHPTRYTVQGSCLGKDTVSKEHQDDEVGAEEHATLVNAAVRANAGVHHLVPVLSCQNLQQMIAYSLV